MVKVLVIDDNELARESVTMVLEDQNYEVFQANDGDIGIDMMGLDAYDVVVTDLIMPTMHGIDVLCEIKQLYPETKVIVVSGGSRVTPLSHLDLAKKLGADGILGKPFTANELQMSMQAALS